MPDFFIVGAMKCGTTTLHHLLEQHSAIYIPAGEPNLFTIDDFEAFPQAQWNGELVTQDLDRYWDAYADWFSSLIPADPSSICLGEDSAGYLSSSLAIDRIAQRIPAAKLIVLLRDPLARTYSHYWHWVRTGRAMMSFEDCLRFGHGNLLQRSYYEKQLNHCYRRFPKDQVKVLIFEQFVRSQEETVEEVFRFLELPKEVLVTQGKHENRGQFPHSLSLKLFENYLFRQDFGLSYTRSLPRLPGAERESLPYRLARNIFRRLNPSTSTNSHQMKPSTRAWLKDWLRRRNSGLSELVGLELERYWPTFRED